MVIRAEFTGTDHDGSYRTGIEFTLQVLTDERNRPRIVSAMPGGKPRNYTGWPAFWKQWRRV